MDGVTGGAQVQSQAAIYTMNVAKNVTADTVATLISSVQQTAPTYSNPAHLGNSIDTHA